jgi:signal peptidase II
MLSLSSLKGPKTMFGVVTAVAALLLDQGHKTWMLHVYNIGKRHKVEITSYFDLVLAWNTGVSYGLFRQETAAGRVGLALFAVVAAVFIAVWLAQSTSALSALSLGLIMGGGLGNALDRLIYGAVADFFSLHWGGFNWYVFNVADIAIVAGIIGLVYDLLMGGHKRVPNAP